MAKTAVEIQNRLKELAAEMVVAVESDNDAGFEELTTEADRLTAELAILRGVEKPDLNDPKAIREFATKSSRVTSNNRTRDDKRGSTMSNTKLSDGGFASIGEFLAILNSEKFDPRIQTLSVAASQKMSGSAGVLVPERFASEMLGPDPEAELVYPMARKYSMTENTMHISGLENFDSSDGSVFGGLIGQWVSEGESFDDVQPKASRLTLTRHKLGIFSVASSELVSDSDFESQLAPALMSAIQEHRDYAFLNGNGAAKPMGVLNATSTIEVAKENGQAADTIVYENLTAMYSRLHPSHVRRAIWACNPTCIPALLSIVREVGTGGVPVPVLNESNGSFSMLGLPVKLSSKLPTLGDAGDLVLADFSQYAIGADPVIAIAKSEHYKFQTDQVCWRAIFRCDGQSTWRTAYTPRIGSTLSWAVKLGERA